ncbi:MAG TPA: hypothetical protein VFB33_05420 [Candidatus Binataceae bacterium]|nr:hypothetical protein [Candidatus Binataceae bacterium]
MPTLIDNPAFAANEVYEIQQTDPVEGAGSGASFSGIGISNQPHQQLANRTAFLKQRQDTNVASIAALQATLAKLTCSLQTNGYLKIPLTDVSRGPVVAIIQWGYFSLAQQNFTSDTQFVVSWPIPFPNAILLPPLATNVYYHTSGGNLAASVVSWGLSGATFVLDVPGNLSGVASPPWTGEKSNGFSWLAVGF